MPQTLNMINWFRYSKLRNTHMVVLGNNLMGLRVAIFLLKVTFYRPIILEERVMICVIRKGMSWIFLGRRFKKRKEFYFAFRSLMVYWLNEKIYELKSCLMYSNILWFSSYTYTIIYTYKASNDRRPYSKLMPELSSSGPDRVNRLPG